MQWPSPFQLVTMKNISDQLYPLRTSHRRSSFVWPKHNFQIFKESGNKVPVSSSVNMNNPSKEVIMFVMFSHCEQAIDKSKVFMFNIWFV